MLEIGVLEGSLRRQSLSRAFAKNIKKLAPHNISVKTLPSCGDLPLFNQDLLDEKIPDSVSALETALLGSQGILIVTPEYNWSIPGVLKNAIDWASRLKSNPLQSKPVAIWTVAPGLLGGARAHESIRHILHSQNMHILAKPEVQISSASTKINLSDGKIKDATTEEFLKSHLKLFSEYCLKFS